MIERVMISIALMMSVALVLASNIILSADNPLTGHSTAISFVQELKRLEANQDGILNRGKVRATQVQGLRSI